METCMQCDAKAGEPHGSNCSADYGLLVGEPTPQELWQASLEVLSALKRLDRASIKKEGRRCKCRYDLMIAGNKPDITTDVYRIENATIATQISWICEVCKKETVLFSTWENP